MIKYILYQKNPASHYIYIDMHIDDVNANKLQLQLPAWRPGRYELGNFAKNIKRVDVFNEKNELCGWRNTKTAEEKISRPAKEYFQKAFSGIHVIDKKLISLIHRHGKFSMVDVYLDLAGSQKILSFDHSGSKFIDVGKPDSVAAAEAMFL